MTATGSDSPPPAAALDMDLPERASDLPERLGYRLKRRLLGQPLTNDQLRHERLSKPLALGVLAPDCISSSAYGTEEILIELLPYAGLAAFSLVLPITGVILVILLLLTLAYRDVVMVYTRAGGSYIVARENFGPRIAQIAAVALLIDYIVTVAVQSAAGTVAVASAIPALGPYSLEITVGVVVLLTYGNLRGIKEAGRAFAFPTYFFSASIAIMIVVGIVRALLGNLPQIDPTQLSGVVPIAQGSGFVEGATLLVLLRAFANGGSSLTGLEAISNGVSAFRPPEGRNARQSLVVMASILGFLVGGVSLLAFLTHAAPHLNGYPSVLSQEARLVFGTGPAGHVLYLLVQTASAMILYTGANTSFNGFPFLASFVAEDQFLPRQLRRRGHRLVFSNAILLLAAISIGLLVLTRAQVNSLVPFYAIGVFTGFTMAGLGMARHHQRHRGHGWRRKAAVSLAAGLTSLVVVAIFAVAKFTEGAWMVVVLFPILVALLIRLNRQYREEEAVLGAVTGEGVDQVPQFSRHLVLVFVDSFDLATLEAVRYGKSLRPTELRAVHFVLDGTRAELLRKRWEATGARVALELVDCPDRRLGRAALELVGRANRARSEVTVLLPRRGYSPFLGRLLHDRTADRIARVISRAPHAVATIVPFDTEARLALREQLQRTGPQARATAAPPPAPTPPEPPRRPRPDTVRQHAAPEPPEGVDAIADLRSGRLANVQGRVRSVRLGSVGPSPTYLCEIVDSTGVATLQFYGRRQVRGIEPGVLLQVHGRATTHEGQVVLANPTYELLSPVGG